MKTTMKAICFMRNGKPDMRLIHDDIGDTPEKIMRKLEVEFEGWELDIRGIKGYEDATEWVRFYLDIETGREKRLAAKKRLDVLTTELTEHKKQCEKCDRRECGDCSVSKFMFENYIPCLAEAVTA